MWGEEVISIGILDCFNTVFINKNTEESSNKNSNLIHAEKCLVLRNHSISWLSKNPYKSFLI